MIQRNTIHEIEVNAKAERVYKFLSDVSSWADIFPPTIYAQRIHYEKNTELIQIWATANNEVKSWKSERKFNHENFQITFQQTTPAHPLLSMVGTWEVQKAGEGTCLVRLKHSYRVNSSEDAKIVEIAIDNNSNKELESLRNFFQIRESEYLSKRVEETLPITSSVTEAMDFLRRADKWPSRINHVADAEVDALNSVSEILRLTTISKDGSTHKTSSYRVFLSDQLIVYKQIATPGALVSHRGEWYVFSENNTTYVKTVHEFALTRDTVTKVLGDSISLESAADIAGKNLIHNSLQTIRLIDSVNTKVAE